MIIALFHLIQQEVFAASPTFVRQVITDTSPNDWFLLPSNDTAVLNSDGRIFAFNMANLSQCQIGPYKDFPPPDLSGVSYFSNGTTLNSTLWLSGPFVKELSNDTLTSPFVPISKVHQEFFL